VSKSDGASRIVSMDQFRGYTVAGMFLVNFLGGYAAIHPVLKHNNNYFSYADSIMPSFMFACGFSYRLTALRRVAQDGAAAYWRFVWRSLGLVLVSLLIFGFDQEFKHWADISTNSAWLFLVKLVKANLWEVLAIIGVAQLLILPVIAASARVRLLTIAGFLLVHYLITAAFNWNFLYGGPNRLDALLGTQGSTAWDGGVFGLLMWAAIMLAGSLAYDVVVAAPGGRAAFKMITAGVVLMVVGYALSCLSMLYDGESPSGPGKSAASPVVPPLARLSGRPLASLLVEPPLVQPPSPENGRPINYWMMNKKIVSLPFVVFSTGWAVGLFGLFILICDRTGWGIGLFRTFGQNALAAYLLHEMAEKQVHTIVPDDSPLKYVMVGLALFYSVTYLTVRYLEKQGVYIRL
jgi:predicted acyltransferase